MHRKNPQLNRKLIITPKILKNPLITRVLVTKIVQNLNYLRYTLCLEKLKKTG